jgi:PilZ domain
MTPIMPPRTGEEVSILAPHSTRLRGQVAAQANGSMTIALEQTPIRRPFHFAAGSEVALEWIDPRGVMQLSAWVAEAQAEPRPTLLLELVGVPEPVERREHGRSAARLEVSVWALAQPTRRLAGTTVNLSAGGALLDVPGLALPGGPVHASAKIVWRRDPALVGVEFERISPEARARLLDFVRAP